MKKKMIPFTENEKKKHEKQNKCYICEKKFTTDDDDDKKHDDQVRDHCHYTGKYRDAAHSICNFRYNTTREISPIGHHASTYDYHLIIKELAKEFKGMFKCLGENTGKYITFSVSIKNQLDNGKTIT